MTHPLYRQVKAELKKLDAAATASEIAEKIAADPDAARLALEELARLALEELARRGKARHCGSPVNDLRKWSAR